jgi:2,3-bisphosphoglycerate-dependent phosphoglycerate mutase
MIKKHGNQQVHIWRRSFDIPPPPMDLSSPHHPSKNKTYSTIPAGKIPSSESLKNTFDRVVPYYEKKIEPLISLKKNILIAAHGNSLRALCKKIFNISKEKIVDFGILNIFLQRALNEFPWAAIKIFFFREINGSIFFS